MVSSTWHTAHGADVPSSEGLTSSFKVHAPPKTDVWRRNDEDDTFNSPMIYQKIRISQFKALTATVFAPWKTQYDQGGIILVLPSTSGQPSQWTKAGIEYFNSEPQLAVVGCHRYSDWSLSPMSASYQQKATFKAVKEETTLWIYAKQEGAGELRPMREIKWAFHEGDGKEIDGELWVGVYAAKPTTEEDDADGVKGIDVTFSGLEVELLDE